MEQIQFNQVKIKQNKKANERGDYLVQLATKLNRPLGQIAGITRGWNTSSLKSIFLSSESMARDMGIEFGKSFWWHMKKIKEELKS